MRAGTPALRVRGPAVGLPAAGAQLRNHHLRNLTNVPCGSIACDPRSEGLKPKS